MKKVLQQPAANIERLLQHGQYLEYLSKRVLTFLPAEFAGKITVLGLSGKDNHQILVIAAISPAWASKLRFHTPILKRCLMAEPRFSRLQKIVIKVAFSNINTKFKENKPNYSQNSAKVIENSAQHITDEGLKGALMRLSRHVAKEND